MLHIEKLSCGYGSATVLHEVSLNIQPGEIVALIGPNGAGKTTAMQCVAGHVKAQLGRLMWTHGGSQTDITRFSPEQRVKQGIAISPEGRKLFGDMTVRENLVVGGYSRPKAVTETNIRKVLDVFPRLAERFDSLGRTLSGGEQQMVAIGRAMMAEPKLLLVDELSLGLMPKNVDICYQALKRLQKQGIAVLLVEQNLAKALAVSDRAYVLDSGRLMWSGSSAEARQKTDLVETILGHHATEP